jgi:hypothetical protein
MRSAAHHWSSILARAVAGTLLCVTLSTLSILEAHPSVAGAATPALTVSPTSLNFGNSTLGTFVGPLTFTLTNSSKFQSDTLVLPNAFVYSGVGAEDWFFSPQSSCPGNGGVGVDTIVLGPGKSCTFDNDFLPGALGPRTTTLSIHDSLNSGVTVSLTGVGTIGYYQVSSAGAVGYAGDAGYYGQVSGPLNKPVVGISPTGNDGGYYLVASDGGIFAYGGAVFFGSPASTPLNRPVVGMSTTFGDKGYWMVASDGGIFSYGNAQFYGSTGGTHLNQPIVGMAATPDGGGYWLVASDGGIFAYGDAQFYGSTGAIHLNQPIVAMAAMPDGGGYWFTAADGGLFNYGNAPFYGSGVGLGLGQVVAMATDGSPTIQAQSKSPALRSHLIPDLASGAGPSDGQSPPVPRDAAPTGG